jgi:hypothetical protein
MLLSRFPFLMRAVLALTLALALAGAGAAHRPVERPGGTAAEFAAMAAFLAAGGSVDDLCHDAGMAGHEGGHGQRDCPACVLQKCAMGVAVVALPVPVRGRMLALWPVAQGQPVARDPMILPPARGPPETTFS